MKIAKFKKGQVVMVVKTHGAGEYPVKLDHVTHIGTLHDCVAWMDSLNNVEYEIEMRHLNKREMKR